ncbi:MAG TPA: NAD(P)/FAD-dependent oxidoreductase [Dehalococcoidia bacterium]|nr:NAD(P)/FAD-dependent oxidoreductase [Dehalococcoidia bacterium]
MKKTKYLIIGNSAGGIGAAEAIRELDNKGAIIIVSDEPYPAYSRPLIADYLSSHRPLEKMLFRPAGFYEDNDIDTVFGDKVTGIDFAGYTATLADGKTLQWQKLLLATGGVPIVPNVEGLELKGVFSFITLDDAKAIDDFITDYRMPVKAVIIGGGLIGISASEALVRRGVRVTIVEMKDRVLNTILDEEASSIEAEAVTNAGVDIITGHTVSRVNGSRLDEVKSTVLDDGRTLDCQMVVIAIGVRPRLELVIESDIKKNLGIIVDRHMATSQPDAYACGDVAEVYEYIYRENRLIPIWPNAYLGGRVAGCNMAGGSAEYPGGTAMNSVKYFGVDTVSAGMVVPPDVGYEVFKTRHDDIYKKVVLKDGLIVGMIFSGDIEKSGIVYNLMRDRVNVSGFKEALVSDDFGLVSLPEEIWRSRLAVTTPSETCSSGVQL